LRQAYDYWQDQPGFYRTRPQEPQDGMSRAYNGAYKRMTKWVNNKYHIPADRSGTKSCCGFNALASRY